MIWMTDQGDPKYSLLQRNQHPHLHAPYFIWLGVHCLVHWRFFMLDQQKSPNSTMIHIGFDQNGPRSRAVTVSRCYTYYDLFSGALVQTLWRR